jgi:hypothetical protein
VERKTSDGFLSTASGVVILACVAVLAMASVVTLAPLKKLTRRLGGVDWGPEIFISLIWHRGASGSNSAEALAPPAARKALAEASYTRPRPRRRILRTEGVKVGPALAGWRLPAYLLMVTVVV